ncbi:MAG: hypothetical protein V1861_01120 [Candidatus Micrarchaeota archaeon]
MVYKSVGESAQTAAAALNQTVSNAGNVLSAVPQPGHVVVLERSAVRAMDSMRTVDLQALAVSEFLNNPAGPPKAGRPGQERPDIPDEIRVGLPGRLGREQAGVSPEHMLGDSALTSIRDRLRNERMDPEARYAVLEGGHPSPPIVYTQEEVDAYAEEAESQATRHPPSHITDDALSGWVQRAIPILDSGFLGEELYSRFTQTPPVATAGASNIGEDGIYFGSTNSINFTNSSIRWLSEANSECLVLHEMLHYAAYLGGGMDIRWRDGETPVFSKPGWKLHEGGTEYFAQLLTRQDGISPTMVSYPPETLVWVYMGAVLGEDSTYLRMAYLSGDFTEVRSRIDARLGAGTFDSLLSTDSASAALSFLQEKMAAAGIDYHKWDADPIVSAVAASRRPAQT